jgi:hypothetical protein
MFTLPTGTPGAGFVTATTRVPANWFNYVSNNYPNAVDGVGGGYYQLTGANLRFCSNNRIVKFNQADASFPLELRGYVTIGLTDEADYATGVGTLTVSVPTTFSSTLAFTAGGTFTQSTVNGHGVTATGNGTGEGVTATGGASNGTGVFGTGGATNGIGVEGQGTGNGAGGGFIGGTGGTGVIAQGGTNQPGIKSSGNGTGVALDCLVGGVKFSGTAPVSTADPGANTIHGISAAKAWALIATDGAGNVAVLDGMNVASITLESGGTVVAITFARTFGSGAYAVTFGDETITVSQAVNCYQKNSTSSTAGVLRVVGRTIVDSGGTTVTNTDFSAVVRRFAFEAHGRE